MSCILDVNGNTENVKDNIKTVAEAFDETRNFYTNIHKNNQNL